MVGEESVLNLAAFLEVAWKILNVLFSNTYRFFFTLYKPIHKEEVDEQQQMISHHEISHRCGCDIQKSIASPSHMFPISLARITESDEYKVSGRSFFETRTHILDKHTNRRQIFFRV
jgi:hypothetical protein